MKVLTIIGSVGKVFLAGLLMVGTCIMNFIGLMIGAITS